MATIVVETGSIVSGANSYVSTATLSTFATDRGITISGTLADLLIKAMDYIESLQYKGVKRTSDQALQWPRTDVYVDTYYVNSDSIPQDLKDALCHCAIAIDQGNDPLQDIPQKAIRKKVGDLEIEYSSGSSAVTINKRIGRMLWKLLDGSSGSNTINVSKG